MHIANPGKRTTSPHKEWNEAGIYLTDKNETRGCKEAVNVIHEVSMACTLL